MLPSKHSKECEDCQRRYPTTCGVATCLVCRKELKRSTKEPTVTEDEFKDLSYIHGRVIPGPLSEEERDLLHIQWEMLEEEAERRAPWFSTADLIGEGFAATSVRRA